MILYNLILIRSFTLLYFINNKSGSYDSNQNEVTLIFLRNDANESFSTLSSFLLWRRNAFSIDTFLTGTYQQKYFLRQ